MTAEPSRRIAAVLSRHVARHARPDGCQRRCLTQALHGDDRRHLDEALDFAAQVGHLVLDGGWRVPTPPSSPVGTAEAADRPKASPARATDPMVAADPGGVGA